MTGRLPPLRFVILAFIAVFAAFGSAVGVTFAATHQATTTLPCRDGGDNCIHIGFTDAWLNGTTVQLEYTHNFFCEEPPSSGATSDCEAGAPDQVDPPSGPIVSPLYAIVPLGFTPPLSTLQCPTAGRCINHPHTIDLSRLFGEDAANAALPPHSHVIVDDEHFQSTWWPLINVGVKNLAAWNAIVAAKSHTAVQACQSAGNCTADIPTNVYLFFQVLGPGMSPQGPG